MIYAYLRVSTEKQTLENQRFEVSLIPYTALACKRTTVNNIHITLWNEEHNDIRIHQSKHR